MGEDARSLTSLFTTAATQLSLLVRTEVRLARAEVSQKVALAGLGIGLIGCAAVLAIPTLVLLLMGLAAWLTQRGLSPAAADAAVGAGGLVVAIVLMLVGLSRLRPEALTPERTLSQLRKDTAMAKDHIA